VEDETKDLDPEEDFKYLRPGHVHLDRQSDLLVEHLVEMLPGTGTLPAYWRWVSQESFIERFEDLGQLVWAKTASYHMLMICGRHAFRVWTDSSESCIVDVDDSVAVLLAPYFEVIDVPESTYRKTRPFTKRIRIKTIEEIDSLLLQTVTAFGLA